jgi:hypothetical protein
MRRRPRASLLAAAACLALVVALAGCSSDEEEGAPSACLVDSEAYIRALQAAPAAVRLDGATPVSECLTSGQEGGELSQIGQEIVTAATVLNDEARRSPEGPAAVQLGYLVGAVERGAEGIHADLVRRVNSAARFELDPVPPDFNRGYEAGLESG